MRLAYIRVSGREEFAVADAAGPWVPVSTMGYHFPDTRAAIEHTPQLRAALAAGRGRPLEVGQPTFRCPVVRPSKVLGVGLNYMDHIRETGADVPERPIIFGKYPNALTGPTSAVVVDSVLTEQADYESELAVVVGARSRRLAESSALEAVFGYAVANDVSARDWQKRDSQFSRSKSYDTFCPIGPWITTADEIADPQNLRIGSTVNGERRQDSTTKEMIFSVAYLLAFLSRTMTLEPGDIVLTGTPHGVGFARKPPVFLQPGDVVDCEIEKLGGLSNPIVGPGDPGSHAG